MLLNTKTALSEVVRKGFGGKAVELLPSYPHFSTLERQRAEIGEMIKVISGPLYQGEAEALLLNPLLTALRTATTTDGDAAIARHAYQIAAAYALIFDISKISQSKDIAKEITIDSIRVQPIVTLFTNRAKLPESDNKDLRVLWSQIDSILRDGLIYKGAQFDTSKITPLGLAYQATSPSAVVNDLAPSTVNVWNNLLRSLRHGKGTPLDRGARKTYMATISEIMLRIDALIDRAKSIDVYASGEEGADKLFTSTAFVDAYTAMYWFKIYLTAIQQYDIVFPASEIMVQSQAWVLTIKTQSAKLKKLFTDIAQVSISYEIFTAIRYWKEVYAFWEPMLNKSLSATEDMNSVWHETEVRADKLLSMYAKSQVNTVLDDFKRYMDADHLLPERDFKIASDILQLWQAQKPVAVDGEYVAITGVNVVTSLDTVGERIISTDDRELLVPKLASSASQIEDALAYVRRAREILQLSEETDDIYHALIPDGITWSNPYALVGTVEDMNVASFERSDPMQLAYEKYVITLENTGTYGAIGSLDWRFTNLLMKPFYKKMQMQEFASARSASSRIIWPNISEIPSGDVISVQYLAQPIPAAYTASRNSNFTTNDMVSYLTLMSGHSGITASSRDLFRKVAAILKTYPDTYGRNVLDALAATMFVYKVDGNAWNILTPSCPTIYGMPLQAMIEANELKTAPKTSEATYSRVSRISLDDGDVYAFVLHSRVPQPGPMVYFAYPYAKGAYVQIPLLKSVYLHNESSIQSKLGVNFKALDNTDHDSDQLDALCEYIRSLKGKALGDAKTIPTLGWAPFLLNMPHMLCSYQDENSILTDVTYRDYPFISVRVRYDDVDRTMYVAGFIDNPVELLDMTDYEASYEQADPSPIDKSAVVAEKEIMPDTSEKPRAESDKHPDPTTLGAGYKDEKGNSDPDAQLANVGKIVSSPVVDKGTIKLPSSAKGADSDEPTHAKEANEPMRGDVLKECEDKGDAPERGKEERYWKKIATDGKIIEVIKAIECPDGFVPASEEEYRKYIVEKSETLSKEASGQE